MGSNKKSTAQKDWVRNQLLTNGFITRNKALDMYITRLSAIIYALKEENLNIVGRRRKLGTKGLWGESWDYEYILVRNDKENKE